ncbi:hypothetical protein EC973_005290 [Apophysomyces ossiformis]|uniref:Methyltransferase domain-containing protein n=1 Tax=Apophysomyces ossiformis TaxID=679940 RepID=A0A8H7BS47_9FUNG|nr:hypothetical protein EC973_005290 [Apophysomyces ossiformis]
MGNQVSKKRKSKHTTSGDSSVSCCTSSGPDSSSTNSIPKYRPAYFFPNNEIEASRLHSEHYLYKHVFQKTYFAPVTDLLQNTDALVLDVGCGVNASWIIDVATDFPKATFYGIDMVEPLGINAPEIHLVPQNCRFQTLNILDGIPHQDNLFDFVHQRMLCAAYTNEDLPWVMKELMRVTKPEGYVELMESLPSAEFNLAKQPQTGRRDRHSKSPSRDVEGLALAGLSAKQSSTSSSFTSLASSTLSFFTGYPAQTPSPPAALPPHAPRETRWEESIGLSGVEESIVLNPTTDEGEPISIELGAHDTLTPRSSIETHSSFMRDVTENSPRSSMDSLASSNLKQQQQRHSQLLKSCSTSTLAKKPEHLLWGFAQLVGQFVIDPTLINNNEFAPLKHRTMYRPHGVGFGGGGGGLLAKPDAHSKIDTRTTPVFSTPPSILFVDLDLTPGETRKFSYKLKLPNDIPPSYRGRAIRFNYYLVVGTQRSSSVQSGSQGQTVQIPFRVLNHVSEDGSRPIYDLMNPVVMYKDEAAVEGFTEDDFKSVKTPKRRASKSANNKAREEFGNYVNELLANKSMPVHELTRRESDAYDVQETDDQVMDDTTGLHNKTCAQIVSRLANTSRKAMYDICKNNQRVAQLHLIKTAYRLGEPVMGVLDFEGAALSTFEVSIFLESNEAVEPSIALRQPHQIARISRKCHAEHHSFCLGHRQLAFSLPIPTIASPEFQTTGVKLQYYLKFEFITSTQNESIFSPLFLPINVDNRHKHYQSAQQVDVSTFDCQIPIRVYGSPGGADRALYGRPHSFSVK